MSAIIFSTQCKLTNLPPISLPRIPVHDPSISGPMEYPSWLPAATAKTNAQIIVDRLGAHRDSVVHQENPLVAQSIWENCRPSHHGRGRGVEYYGNKNSILELEQEWNDTYSLVCNSNVSIFTGGVRPTNIPLRKVSDLQKLCIVRAMYSSSSVQDAADSSSQLHRDYVFTPTHSLHSELCMILQARYFLLADVNYSSVSGLSPEDIVKEITYDEYECRTTPWAGGEHRFDPSRVVAAHQVAFAPKGDHSANVSIWFDAQPVKLEQSQIKRSRRLKQKKKTQIRNEHTGPNSNGALISRTSSADFPCGAPDIDPFVLMLPAEDNEDSHHLIMAIIDHRIDSIIIENCPSFGSEQKKQLYLRTKQLQQVFIGMSAFHKKWVWPKRAGLERITVTTKAPPGNIMPYIPISNKDKDGEDQSSCIHNWHNFVKEMGCAVNEDDTDRLSAFLRIMDGSNSGGKLPHITPFVYDWWNQAGTSSKYDDTWKEILLGLVEDGKWEAALQLHNKKRSESFGNAQCLPCNSSAMARNKPLSTIPFVA